MLKMIARQDGGRTDSPAVEEAEDGISAVASSHNVLTSLDGTSEALGNGVDEELVVSGQVCLSSHVTLGDRVRDWFTAC
jgi:hypothetical protein